jgi:hypothetical protein
MLSGSLSGITAVFSKMCLIFWAKTTGIDAFTMLAFWIAFLLAGFSMVFTVYNMNVNLALYS